MTDLIPTVSDDTIEKNAEQLITYSEMRPVLEKRANTKTREGILFKEILAVLDLAAESVNGDTPSEDVDRKIYHILS